MHGMASLWDACSSMEKTASTTENVQTFTRRRLRQECVLDRVLPAQIATPDMIERRTEDNWPLIRVEKELETKAFSVGFNGEAQTNYFDGELYEVLFAHLRTQEHRIIKEKLLTMRTQPQDYFNRHAVFDLGVQIDRSFKAGLDKCVVDSNYTLTGDGPVFNKTEGKKMLNKLDDARKPNGCFIMAESRWNDLYDLNADQIGFQSVQDITFGGVKKIQTFMGIPVVRSIEVTDAALNPEGVWDKKQIYLVTTPDFLGKNFILDDVTYHMDRRYNEFAWGAWMSRGLGISAQNGVVRLDLA